MDEKLTTTIQRIKLLSEQNPEFKTEMQKMFGKATSALDVSHDERITQMLKYLGLDAHVDHMDSVIDYSFISEEVIRNTLESDNREMIRFRYGTRYHSICFDEFCRYAHLQAEMLLNFYYDKKNGNNIKNIINQIKKYNPTASINDKAKTLGDIPYNSKLWAFKYEYTLDYETNNILDYLRRIRNESSHRSPENEDKSICDYKKQLNNIGMPLTSDGIVDYYKLVEGTPQKNIYKNVVVKSDWYKDYKYLIWLHKEPFGEVIKALEELKQTVKDNIST